MSTIDSLLDAARAVVDTWLHGNMPGDTLYVIGTEQRKELCDKCGGDGGRRVDYDFGDGSRKPRKIEIYCTACRGTGKITCDDPCVKEIQADEVTIKLRFYGGSVGIDSLDCRVYTATGDSYAIAGDVYADRSGAEAEVRRRLDERALAAERDKENG